MKRSLSEPMRSKGSAPGGRRDNEAGQNETGTRSGGSHSGRACGRIELPHQTRPLGLGKPARRRPAREPPDEHAPTSTTAGPGQPGRTRADQPLDGPRRTRSYQDRYRGCGQLQLRDLVRVGNSQRGRNSPMSRSRRSTTEGTSAPSRSTSNRSPYSNRKLSRPRAPTSRVSRGKLHERRFRAVPTVGAAASWGSNEVRPSLRRATVPGGTWRYHHREP